VQPRGDLAVGRRAEVRHQLTRLRERQVVEVDLDADVERRGRGRADQLARQRRAGEHEDQTREVRLLGAEVEQATDEAEKLPAERRPQHRVGLIEEHDQPLGRRVEPRAEGSERPGRLDGLRVEPRGLGDRRENAGPQRFVVGHVEQRQVDGGAAGASVEGTASAQQQARLAALPRSHDIGVTLPRGELLTQRTIGVAFDVRWTGEGPSGAEGDLAGHRYASRF
jgi:hypothetical protein